MKTLQELTRPNIWKLKPYSSARDEYKGVTASVFLDAILHTFLTDFLKRNLADKTIQAHTAISFCISICPGNADYHFGGFATSCERGGGTSVGTSAP